MSVRRGNYGFDAPWALAGLVLGGLALLCLAAVSFVSGVPTAGVVFLLGGLYTLASAASHLYTARRGKFAVWGRELDRLKGDEWLLDLGCGRGAVLLPAAERLPEGRAVGIDLWRVGGRPRNHGERLTRANAEAEGVTVGLVAGDMRDLPFGDATFDVVVSGLAPRGLLDGEGRALREAYRVLRPGGLLLIADQQRHGPAHEAALRGLGVVDVRRRDLGWRYWYGGPWAATWMVEARKPVTE
ncbi:class I SAM-dependent methyltransferase [Nonomuraea lactucae]|uniref:class I SAM-dependent methyltransferase n=1 Tax=Nonomuraea lactucae TaxID=2249762 RepID=UPI000DE4C8BB|nr:class I SAM-dependent methyltransferase [Nonomuraea lactucae]